MEEDVLHANCPARLIVPSQGDENIHLVDNGLVEASRRIPAMNGQGDWESQISHLDHAPSHGEM